MDVRTVSLDLNRIPSNLNLPHLDTGPARDGNSCAAWDPFRYEGWIKSRPEIDAKRNAVLLALAVFAIVFFALLNV